MCLFFFLSQSLKSKYNKASRYWKLKCWRIVIDINFFLIMKAWGKTFISKTTKHQSENTTIHNLLAKNYVPLHPFLPLLPDCSLLSKSESVKFWLIESVICLFTDSSVNKIFFTVKSVNFHWNNQWDLTDLQ